MRSMCDILVAPLSLHADIVISVFRGMFMAVYLLWLAAITGYYLHVGVGTGDVDVRIGRSAAVR